MKNKYRTQIKIALGAIFASMLFTACGGGGDSASFENSETIIPISIACVTDPDAMDISNYITLNSGDVIIKDNDGAEVSIYHDVDGLKKVCLVTPSAHILRK